MIQIEQIEISEFRGIRHLILTLGRKSFGIAGPNGTGKSGIVDAAEFGLTGNITRLAGEGTADLSVKAHAPHVDSNKKPEKAVVKITGYAASLGKSITIERSVKATSTPTITPNDAKTREFVAKLETHPEFALSRRQIIKYILTPPGKRSTDVQTLLRLEQVEKVRASLLRVMNDTKKEATKAEVDDTRAKQEFFQHLGLRTPSKSDLLSAVNERRTLLKLDPLGDLTPEISIKAGVIADASKGPVKPKLSKAGTSADLEAYGDRVAEAKSFAVNDAVAAGSAIIVKLTNNPTLLKSIRQKLLVEQGLPLVDEDFCPLCDYAWEANELRAHLRDKLTRATEAAAAIEDLANAVRPVLQALDSVVSAANKVVQACGNADPIIDPGPLREFATACNKDRGVIEKACSDPDALAEAAEALNRAGNGAPANAEKVVGLLKTHVDALPEPSKEEAAKEFLIVAEEKYNRGRTTKTEVEVAAKRADTAAKVFSEYAAVSTAVLEGIYDTVQKDFTEYYSFINRDDEDKFEGMLTPSVGKLAFDVDFYGRGKFPPGAYHSEGHQDGTGLCLYLALMNHTLGTDFTLAVLDDVLMSVDAGHRREVCQLLKTKFPKTQFILTTHDPVWLQFMRTEHLIQGSASFGGWTVDSGPQVWNEDDVWKQIDDKLKRSDVSGAAQTLRRYLEYISTILADNLRARTEYHANGQYDLGDLWPAVVRAWKDRLQEAKDSAVSWKKGVAEIEGIQKDAKQKIGDTQSENWMINKAVHYNQWANLQPKEFAAVAAAFQAFLKSMQCAEESCLEFLHVSPVKGDKETLRCGCGGTILNLTISKGKVVQGPQRKESSAKAGRQGRLL
jgi:recombinational DNA repair ATPase RecF